MATVAVHIGAHKTGTSLIQKYLRDKPEQTAPFGIRAVSRGDCNSLIGWGKVIIDEPHRLGDRLAAEVAAPGASFVVVSHENTLGRPHQPSGDHLYPQAEARVAALASILEPFETRVVFYLRRTVSFLESYYLQLIHQGEFFTFDQWLDRVDLDRVSWRPVVEMLRDAFGADRVSIGDFDEIKEGQDEFLRRFLRRVDPSIDVAASYRPRRNPSISDKGLQIALSANPYLRSADERKAMRKFLQANFSNTDYARPRLFTAEQRAGLEERYDPEYDSLVDH
jgi:hypothetical protein